MEESSDLSWILELVLTHPISPFLLHRIILSLPPFLPSSPRIKKAVLLRRLVSLLPSLSTQILLTLELIVHIHIENPLLTPNRNPSLLRSAYLHAAVGATLSPLRRGDAAAFLLEVDRIWRRRVGDLQRSGPVAEALVSGELVEAKKMMEEALTSQAARDEVLATWVPQEGVDAVVEYVRAEFEVMRLPSREEAAAERERNAGERNAGAEFEAMDLPSREEAAAERERNARDKFEAMGLPSREAATAERERNTRAEFEAMALPSREEAATEREKNVRVEFEAMGLLSREEVSVERERNGENVNDVPPPSSSSVPNRVPTPEVQKVRQALKRSSKDLQSVVEDPLQYAKEVADNLLARKSEAAMHLDEPIENRSLPLEENHSKMDGSAKAHSIDEENQSTVGGSAQAHSMDPSKATRCSLMDRNPTAQTFEWEDETLDSSCEDGANPPIHLPIPRTKPSSPLQALNVKTARGRKRRRWSTIEEDTLRKAVGEYGKGNWKQILNCYREIFEDRTEVDLKDKWRNLTK